jgi:hypothetical protein
MSEFLLNLLVQISKALLYSKINFYSKKNFLRILAHPAQPRPALARSAPQAVGSPLGPSRVGVFSKRRILFDLAHSGRDAFSLSHHRHVGLACQLHPLPHAG